MLILSATLLSSVKGWKRFRTNAVTGDFLVVMPNCDSVPRPDVTVASSAL